MNILEEFANRNIYFKIRNFSSDDIISSYEIKNIVENENEIIELLNNISCKILNINDYINYCYICHISHFRNNINEIAETHRNEVLNIVDKCEQIKNKISIKTVIDYVLKDYKNIFDYKNENLHIENDLRRITADFIIKYIKKNKDLYEFLCINYSYIIIDKFESVKSIFFDNENMDLINLLLSEENIRKNILYRQDTIQNILKKIKCSSKVSSMFRTFFERYVFVTKELYFDSNEENVIRIYNQLIDCKDFVVSTNEIEAYEYEEEAKKAELLLNNYLEKHGKVEKFEFNLAPLFNLIDNEKIDITLRFFLLTETRKGVDYESVFQNVFSTKSDSVFYDLVPSNIKTDEVFKNSILLNLNICMTYLKRTINHIIRDDNRRIQYVQHIGGCFKNYLDKNMIKYDNNEIVCDINMLAAGINNVLNSYSEKNEHKSRYSTLTLISFVSGLIEKYFRNVYKKVNKENKYIDVSSLKMKNIFDDENFQKCICKENSDCFEYYLLKRNGVGLNIRNIIDHYDEDVYRMLNYDNVLLILSLLLIATNRLLIIK